MTAQVVELIDVQDFLGQQVLNVYHFVDPSGTGDENDVVEDFISDTIPLIKVIQSTQLTHTDIRHRLVFPTAELTADRFIVPPIAGLQDGVADASCDAYSAKWGIGSTVVLAGGFTGHIKRGGCRIGGMAQDAQDGNTIISGFQTDWDAAFVSLQQPGAGDWFLCVASFLVGNPSGPGEPRPRSSTVHAYALVTGTSNLGASTQNTRKFLRGRAS